MTLCVHKKSIRYYLNGGYPSGCVCVLAVAVHNRSVNKFQHGNHRHRFQLLTQTIDVKANQTIGHIHMRWLTMQSCAQQSVGILE